MIEKLPFIIAITKIPGVGSVLAKQLIAYCGGPMEVFDKSVKELTDIPQIGLGLARVIKGIDPISLSSTEVEFISKNNITPLFFLNEDYPRRLRNYDDSPILLYYKGTTDLNHHRMVGVVGTRKPTEYGKLMTERIVEDLKAYDVVIVSGMAYGIDSVSHRKSVECGIPTIGVLGHGLDRLYPATNRQLANKMKLNGGLLSEFPSGTKPDRENFPMRNRIIAALSDAVIVMESNIKGGSIITAEFANSYNKDVFALPGRIDDPVSAGCNRLIKSHKAALIESAKDISYIMRWEEMDKPKSTQTSMFQELNPEETLLIDNIRASKEITIDALHHTAQIPMSQLSSTLLQLEFKGLVKSLPGKKYVLA